MRRSWCVLVNAVGLVAVSAMVLWGCGEPPRKQLPPATADMKSAAQQLNAFAFKLFDKAVEPKTPGNTVVCPASLAPCLAMVVAATRGDSQKGLLAALQWDSGDPATIPDAVSTLARRLQEGGADELQMANSLWPIGVELEKGYVDRMAKLFGAEAVTLPDASSESTRRINEWVTEKTKGRIDRIVEELNPETVLFLANALTFDGAWLHEFDPSDTHEDDFTLSSGRKVRARFMSLDHGKAGTWTDEDGTFGRLDYVGDEFSFIASLPQEGESPEALLRRLGPEGLASKVAHLALSDHPMVRMPKFEAGSWLDLSEPLKELGAAKAFEPSGDFAPSLGSGQPMLYVSRLLHRVWVCVDEKGTRAAAATGGAVEAAAAGDPLNLDRPFAYAILHRPSGVIVLLGVLNDPTQGPDSGIR